MTTPRSGPIALPISPEELEQINKHLSELAPEDILRWAVDRLTGLFQTTAFGLTGLVAIDMLSKITREPPPLIFIDTLFHFPETYQLVEEVKEKYGVHVHVYKPEGCADVEEFERKHGKELWKNDETAYDYYVKVNTEALIRVLLTLGMMSAGRTGSQSVRRIGSESDYHRPQGIPRRSKGRSDTS